MAYFLPQAKNKSEQSELCSDVEGVDTLDAFYIESIFIKIVPFFVKTFKNFLTIPGTTSFVIL